MFEDKKIAFINPNVQCLTGVQLPQVKRVKTTTTTKHTGTNESEMYF